MTNEYRVGFFNYLLDTNNPEFAKLLHSDLATLAMHEHAIDITHLWARDIPSRWREFEGLILHLGVDVSSHPEVDYRRFGSIAREATVPVIFTSASPSKLTLFKGFFGTDFLYEALPNLTLSLSELRLAMAQNRDDAAYARMTPSTEDTIE